LKAYLVLARPFTLIGPALGVVSGALTALGSRHYARGEFGWDEFWLVVLTAVAAAVLNVASNSVNQIYDLEIDRINKPERPLPKGSLSVRQAGWFTFVCYVFGVGASWLVVPDPAFTTWSERASAPLLAHECFFLFLLAAIMTLVYSVPVLGRTKRLTLGANLTISLPRGLMLKVAGWSVLAYVSHWEPWYIGLCFFLFLLGAASTKDFCDLDGDSRGGCQTLPLRFGVRKAAWIIAPFFVLPWLLIPLGVWWKPDGVEPLLSGTAELLLGLGFSLILWGGYTVYLILRDPDALSRVENHPSWKHMYLMMFWAQIGFALAYIVKF